MEQSTIFETQDGSHSMLSQAYGVSYHSKYGAIQESRHVFMEAGLYFKALQQKEIAVLELGFGTGLNAFLTLLESEKHGWHIHYETIEAYPISIEQAGQLNYPIILNAEHFQGLFDQMHTSDWNTIHYLTSAFHFKKVNTRFETIVYQNRFDLIYFDTFSPDTQPELWEPPLLQAMYDALRPNGVLVTYCAKGVVKRRLKNVGFQVESPPGPPGKREMTRAVKAGGAESMEIRKYTFKV